MMTAILDMEASSAPGSIKVWIGDISPGPGNITGAGETLRQVICCRLILVLMLRGRAGYPPDGPG